jgi:inorganic pyrophosphatase
MESNTIYSGHNKEPKQSDMIIPKVLPYDADTENIEKIKELEEQLVDEILEIIVKYAKPKNS